MTARRTTIKGKRDPKYLRTIAKKNRSKKKIEYIGEGPFSEFMLHELVKEGVNVTRYLTTSKPRSTIEGIDVDILDRASLPYEIGEAGDFSLMAFYGQKIPEDVIEGLNWQGMVRDARFFNIHFSLLPEYQGVADPIKEMLKEGKHYGGISMHVVDRELDTGDLVAQRVFRMPELSLEKPRDGGRPLTKRVNIAYRTIAIPEAAKMAKEVLKKLPNMYGEGQFFDGGFFLEKTFYSVNDA